MSVILFSVQSECDGHTEKYLVMVYTLVLEILIRSPVVV